jgi:hypothetical protein
MKASIPFSKTYCYVIHQVVLLLEEIRAECETLRLAENSLDPKIFFLAKWHHSALFIFLVIGSSIKSATYMGVDSRHRAKKIL